MDIVEIEIKNSKDWRKVKDLKRQEINTDQEMVRVNLYLAWLTMNRGANSEDFDSWDQIEEFYCNEQPDEDDMPNSRMNVVCSTIEGMVSQLTDNEISLVTKGQGPEDQMFSEDARIGLDWVLRKNKINAKIKQHELRRCKFGNGWFKVVFDKGFAGGYGLATIQVPPLNKIYVDRKIKDHFRLQEADYIVETMNMSKYWAFNTYGAEKANNLDYGDTQFFDNGVFQEKFETPDDNDSWTLIQWWSKCEGKLRLQEISGCGVLLFDSFKPGDRKDIQKHLETKPRPYYKYVDNQYPYFHTPKYIREGKFNGFGDGKLLVPIQKMLNELYDKIRIQMRPNLTLVDDQAGIDISAFDDNSFSPMYFSGKKLNNRPPAYSIPWGQINPDMYRLGENVHVELQRIVRFSDLMMGQGKAAETATEAAIQQQHGNAHISHEKNNLEKTLAEVLKYALGLMMEFSQGGKSLRVNEDEEEYNFVNFNNMAEVPMQKPATAAYKKEFEKANPGSIAPKFEGIEEKGKAKTKHIELDIDISVGSGMPKNPAFVWSMVEKLSQLMVVDTSEEQPTPKPAINWQEMRDFMKNILGIPIKSDDQMKAFVNAFKKIQKEKLAKNMGETMPETNTGSMPSPDMAGVTAGGGIERPGQGGVGRPPMNEGSGY